mmetsp:Transcript_35272/g.99436  ORF Transcript_35272/g.99436 Transcript_35272/m.99436 type:complete len:100 (+) Transcript_35272:172-471(+)
MGCCLTTATPAPEEICGTWKGETINLKIFPNGNVEYNQKMGTETSYNGPMQWTDKLGVGKICCISVTLDVQGPTGEGDEKYIVVNGERCKAQGAGYGTM